MEFVNKHVINIENILWKLNKIEIFTDKLKQEKILNFEDNKDQLFSIVKNHRFCNLIEKELSKEKIFKKKIYNNKNLSFFHKYELIITGICRDEDLKSYFNSNQNVQFLGFLKDEELYEKAQQVDAFINFPTEIRCEGCTNINTDYIIFTSNNVSEFFTLINSSISSANMWSNLKLLMDWKFG